MGKKTQPGGRVDKATYERFVNYVENKYGSRKGHLGKELERAMEDRMAADNGDQLVRIENDVATIKAMLADAEADGGVAPPTRSDGQDTPAPDSGKPPANATRDKKIDYLIDQFFNRFNRETGECTPDDIREVVQREYAFKEQTLDDYVEAIAMRIGAEEHPRHGVTYVWGDRIEEEKEKLRKEAEEEMEEVSE